MTNSVTLLSLALLATHAAAADLTAFGFRLGEPLTLPECRLISPGWYEGTPARTCYQQAKTYPGYGVPVRLVQFARAEAPPIVRYWQFVAIEREGVLVGLDIPTNGAASQSLVMQLLTDKYGAPTDRTSSPVQNLMGAQFDAITAIWRGPVNVTYLGVLGKIDQGQLIIELPAATALREAWRVNPQERRL